VIEDAFGTQRVKLPAGDLVRYPQSLVPRRAAPRHARTNLVQTVKRPQALDELRRHAATSRSFRRIAGAYQRRRKNRFDT
jgi:predicted 2-oxoglutarate/Fe(II)-dependent dioxygenase YbiX